MNFKEFMRRQSVIITTCLLLTIVFCALLAVSTALENKAMYETLWDYFLWVAVPIMVTGFIGEQMLRPTPLPSE
jgi:FtsH-binding integral membrane protein